MAVNQLPNERPPRRTKGTLLTVKGSIEGERAQGRLAREIRDGDEVGEGTEASHV